MGEFDAFFERSAHFGRTLKNSFTTRKSEGFVAFWAPETFPSPSARGHNKVVFHNEGCLLGMEDESEAGGKIMAGLQKITPFRYAPL